MSRLLGLNVGGTHSSAVLGRSDGQIIRRVAWPSVVSAPPDAMIARMIAEARTLLANGPPVAACGVAIGGPVDAQRGAVVGPPNIPHWHDVPLASRLSAALGLPVRVEHDATACALAEYRWGGGQNGERLAYLTCGTGFGVGLVFDGRPYYGAGGRSPELGHVTYREEGPVAYGKAGSYEAYAAASALGRLAQWRYPDRWRASPPTPPQVCALAAQGDAEAQELIAINARAVGSAVAMLSDLLGVDRVVLGSASRYFGERWVGQVIVTARQMAGDAMPRCTEIVPSSLGARVQDCAALAAALGDHQSAP